MLDQGDLMTKQSAGTSKAAYMRAYRKLSAKAQEYDRRQSRAYHAALAELRERHKKEFETLYRSALESTDAGTRE